MVPARGSGTRVKVPTTSGGAPGYTDIAVRKVVAPAAPDPNDQGRRFADHRLALDGGARLFLAGDTSESNYRLTKAYGSTVGFALRVLSALLGARVLVWYFAVRA
mmetsp:Transcript_130430/g.254142  ORF Transcript_130430/g.254142 Transcript_130430/m.254142 type:complete len:105 (+) Transcript_130430:667-981(+)